jgi:hypothetical protein
MLVEETIQDDERRVLNEHGFAVRGPFADPEEAWSAARRLIGEAAGDTGPLSVIGDFVLPPRDGPPSRNFQTLHFDFGLPLAPVSSADIARFTALHISRETSPPHAVTRLVPLRPLLAARPWPDRKELIRRFARYGESHGAQKDASGYTEGSLARIIEAAQGTKPVLPSVSAQPGFLCGTEFASLSDELDFFRRRGLDPEAVGTDISLGPGELLVFDNLALAHGRRGSRQPGELMQRVYGHRALPPTEQIEVRRRLLGAFARRRADAPTRPPATGACRDSCEPST